MKKSLIMAVIVTVFVVVPAFGQVSLPLVETDTTVPAAAGLVFTINAIDSRGGGIAPQTRKVYEKLGRLSDREFELRRLMSKDILASFSSTFGSLAKVVGERPYDYWISVTKVAPAEIEDFAISFQSDAGRKDYRIGDEREDKRDLVKPVGYSLTLMGNNGYCLAMPRLSPGIYTPVAWVKVKGSKTYRILGIIPISTKMSNSFTGGFQFQVIRSPRDLSNCSSQQLTDVLSDPKLGLGWSAATLDPDLLEEVLNKRQTQVEESTGDAVYPDPDESKTVASDPQPQDEVRVKEPESSAVPIENKGIKCEESKPERVKVEEVQRPVEARTPDFRVEGFDSSVPIELICGGKRVSPQELTATVAIDKLPCAGWYQLHIGFSGKAQRWEISDDSPNKSRFYYDGRHPVVVKVQPKRRG